MGYRLVPIPYKLDTSEGIGMTSIWFHLASLPTLQFDQGWSPGLRLLVGRRVLRIRSMVHEWN